MKVLSVVGARPNFIKIAPLIEELKKDKKIKPILVHTGQHYDFSLSQIFFKELEIPEPDYNLNVGSGTHGEQLGKGIVELEKVLLKEKPNLVVVFGDANACLVGALAAAKLHIPVAHVEAGLRSFDQRMPEEINRKLTDHLSDLLFTTEPQAVKNLMKEGISRKKIFYVGNIMIDTLKKSKGKIENLKFYEKFKLKPKEYAVLTLHRAENVDDKSIFRDILEALEEIQKRIKIIWLIHPRAKKQIKKLGFLNKIRKMKNLILIEPLGYLEMLSLNSQAELVLTDSGGIQEETTVLGVPCLTLREVTERPITVEVGTNIVVGSKKVKILREVKKVLNGKNKKGQIPKYWDGKTAKRIVKIIKKTWQKKRN